MKKLLTPTAPLIIIIYQIQKRQNPEIQMSDNFTNPNKPMVPICPCGEKRMQGIIVDTDEWICWQGHIITKQGTISEFPANIFVA